MSVSDGTIVPSSLSASPPARQRTPRRRTGDGQIPLSCIEPWTSSTPPPLPSPSALPRRSVSSMLAGRHENNNNNNEMMSSPPLLRRRAFSCDDETQQQGASGMSNGTQGNTSSALRTIPSRSEMEDDDDNYPGCDGDGHGGDLEAVRRNTLFSSPTRRGGAGVQKNNNHRCRAASSDVILDIHSCVPSYDDELASHIASIPSDSDVESFDGEEQQRRAASFSTPERQMIARPAMMMGRGRANTCPHKPQRYSIFRQQQVSEGGDEESGQMEDQDSEILLERRGPISSEQNTTPDLNNSLTSGRTGTMSANYSTPLLRSPERRRRTTSHEIPVSTFASPSSSSSIRRTPSRPPLSTPLSTPNPNNTATPTIVEIPNSPQIRSRTTPAPPSTTPTILTATQQAHAQAQNFLFRINPHVMKFLMILSLYMLLAYTWNTDLQFRYKSMEINYGLSEYWHGGLANRVGAAEKIGRNTRGKLFNDDVEEDDGSVAKLMMNGGLEGGEDDKLLDDEMILSASGEDVSANSSDGIPSFVSTTDKTKRRPELSHARSLVMDSFHPAYGVQNQRRAIATAARRPPPSKWTLSRLAWALVWVAFTLPIVEAGIREVRRQMNVRLFFWNVPTRRSWRGALRSMPSGRVSNVHDL